MPAHKFEARKSAILGMGLLRDRLAELPKEAKIDDFI
jgi:hypothetical protein